MGQRTRRLVPAGPEGPEESRPPFPAQGHSGEGSASAMEILQKLEDQRVASLPTDTKVDEEPPGQA